MRTNIEIDDELLEEARAFSVSHTKRGIIEEALTLFVEAKVREKRARTYAERAATIDDRLGNLELHESPSDVLRSLRDRR